MSADRGSVSNPGVELRDLIRKESRKQAKAMDQVLLGEVSDAGDGVTVGILLDGFAAGELSATWANSYTATVGQRVTVLSLKGGQSFFIVGVINDVVDHGALGGLGDNDHPQYALVTYVDSQDHDHATPIAAHAGVSSAHHTRYTDAEAVAAVGTPWTAYLPLAGGVMTGAIGHASSLDIEIGGYNSASFEAAQLVLHRLSGNANEGGQLLFEGGTSYPNDLFVDRYLNSLRVLYSGATALKVEPTYTAFAANVSYGLGAVTGNYGTVQTVGTGKGSWEGYSINGHFVFMSNSTSNVGIYNDNLNKWLLSWDAASFYLKHGSGAADEKILYAVPNAETYLYYNNAYRINTTSTGVRINGVAYVADGTSSLPSVSFWSKSNSGMFWVASTGRVGISNNGNIIAYAASASWVPGTDNTKNLGVSVLRWKDVWAVDTSINSSDERYKKNIKDIDPEQAIALLRAAKPISFQWKGGKKRRTHMGWGAWQMKSALEEVGMSPSKYALWVDPMASPNEDDIKSGVSEKTAKSLRSAELLPIVHAALVNALDRIEALEEKEYAGA